MSSALKVAAVYIAPKMVVQLPFYNDAHEECAGCDDCFIFTTLEVTKVNKISTLGRVTITFKNPKEEYVVREYKPYYELLVIDSGG